MLKTLLPTQSNGARSRQSSANFCLRAATCRFDTVFTCKLINAGSFWQVKVANAIRLEPFDVDDDTEEAVQEKKDALQTVGNTSFVRHLYVTVTCGKQKNISQTVSFQPHDTTRTHAHAYTCTQHTYKDQNNWLSDVE